MVTRILETIPGFPKGLGKVAKENLERMEQGFSANQAQNREARTLIKLKNHVRGGPKHRGEE